MSTMSEPTYHLEFTASTLAFIRALVAQRPHHEVDSLLRQIDADRAKQDAERTASTVEALRRQIETELRVPKEKGGEV